MFGYDSFTVLGSRFFENKLHGGFEKMTCQLNLRSKSSWRDGRNGRRRHHAMSHCITDGLQRISCTSLQCTYNSIECLRKRKYPGYIRDLGNYISDIRQFEAEIWNLKGVNLRTLVFQPDISVCANTLLICNCALIPVCTYCTYISSYSYSSLFLHLYLLISTVPYCPLG